MKILKKRETLLENMTFMAIIAAIMVIINALLALGDMFFPIIGLVLALTLPILTTLVEVSCKDRYYPIFFSVTILLSLVSTLWNIEATFYYLIPSLITGYIFGLCIKKRFPLVYGIFFASVIQGVLIFALSRLVVLLFNVDSIEVFLNLLQLANSDAARLIVFTTIFAFSLIEISFSTLIISFEIERFNISFNDEIKNEAFLDVFILVFISFMMIFYFFRVDISYLLLAFGVYFAIALLINAIRNKKILKPILYGISIALSFVIYILLYKYLAPGSGFLLFGSGPLLISFINLVFILLKK